MLNFKDWEKTAQDDKTVTMKHLSGHTMKIFVTKLPKIQQEAIKRLKMAKGGKVQNFDDGGEASQDSSSDTPAPVAPAANITINAAPAAPNPGAIPAQIPPVQQAPAVAPNFSLPPTPVAPVSNLGNPNNAALSQDAAAQLSQKAATGQEAIDAKTAQGSVPIAQSQQQNAIDTQNRINASAIDMTKHADDFRDYMQTNKIDPNAFMDHKSGGAKAATALGLILGGIGGKGQNNFALDFLNKNIDRAVDAQKTNADNQKTVWGAYNQVYQNQNVATELAKASMADKVIADSNVLKSQLGTAQANVNHQNVVSDMLAKRQDGIMKAALFANQTSGGQSGSSLHATPQSQGSVNPETKNGKPAYGPESADERGIWTPQPMIHDSDSEVINRMAYRAANGDAAAAADLKPAQDEFKQGKIADNIRSQSPRLFGILHDEATRGGQIGKMTAGANTSEVPIVGPLLSAVGSNISSAYNALPFGEGDRKSNRKEEDYNTAAKQLEDNVGIGIGPSTGGERTGKTSGVLSDISSDPENISKHMQSYDDLITSRTKPVTIEKWRKKLGYQ